ncbi:hypothetical protein Y032_0067g104 [Ancylostoma ceylanicum]|uniref:Uncharacterized protein n=1 Tax=Ancylostoma ceylanicum TaxID=53326 RepID=A0A016U0E9_9BILA|nr:hypothetical protein Y032_0067g104 [Ancylostoma ceylanicum]
MCGFIAGNRESTADRPRTVAPPWEETSEWVSYGAGRSYCWGRLVGRRVLDGVHPTAFSKVDSFLQCIADRMLNTLSDTSRRSSDISSECSLDYGNTSAMPSGAEYDLHVVTSPLL